MIEVFQSRQDAGFVWIPIGVFGTLPSLLEMSFNGRTVVLRDGAVPVSESAFCQLFAERDLVSATAGADSQKALWMYKEARLQACGCESAGPCRLRMTTGTCKSISICALLHRDFQWCSNMEEAMSALLIAAAVTEGAWNEDAIRGYLAACQLPMPDMKAALSDEDVLRDAKAIQPTILSLLPNGKFPWY